MENMNAVNEAREARNSAMRAMIDAALDAWIATRDGVSEEAARYYAVRISPRQAGDWYGRPRPLGLVEIATEVFATFHYFVGALDDSSFPVGPDTPALIRSLRILPERANFHGRGDR